MSGLSKFLFAAAAVCALPVQSALAQGEPGGEATGEVGGEVGGEMGGEVGGEAGATTEGGEATAAPDVTDATPAIGGITAWAKEIIFRPLTLNAGMLRVEATPAYAQITITDPISMTSVSGSALGLGLSAGYGVSDQIEVGGGYGFTLDEFEIKGPLSVYGKYRIMDGKMRAAAGASFGYNLASETAGLGAGVDFWYNVSSNLAVYTPGNQLQIGLDPSSAALVLPVGVGFQATPNIFASLGTSLATIGISEVDTAVIFADVTPIQVSGYYSPSNKMDVGVVFDTVDLGGIADVWALTLVGRMFM